MAAILRSSPLLLSPSTAAVASVETPRAPTCFSIRHRLRRPSKLQLSLLPVRKSPRFPTFLPYATFEETAEAGEVVEETSEQEGSDDEVLVGDGGVIDTEETAASVLMATLQSYKQALVNGDQSTVAEIEAFLQSIVDEKNALANKVAALTQELSSERDRILRISADFDNFRKRTERERLSLMTNVQGEVVESLLPVLDNFERAKTQIKVETEGEEKINNSYQSIYKQFMEILTAIGVEEVETVGNAFDPLLHEAIMREDSTEFEEGSIVQEFRKGFKLGERLLRPAMVKVSAGPGPAKPEGSTVITSADEEGSRETEQESVKEGGDPV